MLKYLLAVAVAVLVAQDTRADVPTIFGYSVVKTNQSFFAVIQLPVSLWKYYLPVTIDTNPCYHTYKGELENFLITTKTNVAVPGRNGTLHILLHILIALLRPAFS